MRFQSAAALNKCGWTAETAGCSGSLMLMPDTVTYMGQVHQPLSNSTPKDSLTGSAAAGHKFRVDEVWFDSRGQAVGCYSACVSPFKVFSWAILGWKGWIHFHWKMWHRQEDTNSINREDIQHIVTYIITVDLCASKNISGLFMNVTHWNIVVHKPKHTLHPKQTHTGIKTPVKLPLGGSVTLVWRQVSTMTQKQKR